MRIRSLYLPEYKNLRNFSLPTPGDTASTALEGDEPLVMLLGRNGSGKSNVLEALLTIFRDLDLGGTTSFPYRLEYECNGYLISVDTTGPRRPPVHIRPLKPEVGAVGSLTWSRFCGVDGQRYRPANVFGYYSGQSQRFADLFKDHERHFADELLRSESPPLRRLFLARPAHSQFVLLAFFSDPSGFRSNERYRFIRDELRIEGLDSVLFVLHDPAWRAAAERAMRNRPEEDRDARFWGARGTVKNFLRALHARSLAPLRLPATGKQGRREFFYFYLRDEEALRSLREEAGAASPAEFFSMLESADISDLLEEVRIRVRIRGSDGALTFRELSEGEQQLLTVLGLIEFTRTSEALFLLDEPDTHLNPAWSMGYSRLLIQQMGDDTRSSQVVVATHDPVAIADLTRRAVVLLEIEMRAVPYEDKRVWGFERTGRIIARHPSKDPRGMGVSGVLTSELFGLKTTIDPTTMEKIDRRLELAELEGRSADETLELEALTGELGSLGFNYEFVDPYQAAFSERLSRRYREFQTSLTPEERTVLDQAADQLFAAIMAENEDGDPPAGTEA